MSCWRSPGVFVTPLTVPTGMAPGNGLFCRPDGVDDLTPGHFGVGIDEVGPHRVGVASPLHHAGRAALLDLHADTRLGVVDEEHGRAVARDLEHPPDQSCARHDRHVHPDAVALALPDLDRELEVARRAFDDLGGDRVGVLDERQVQQLLQLLVLLSSRRGRPPADREPSRARRRDRAFSSFSDVALVTPSIQSPTGEKTVSNAPATGSTTSCAPPRDCRDRARAANVERDQGDRREDGRARGSCAVGSQRRYTASPARSPPGSLSAFRDATRTALRTSNSSRHWPEPSTTEYSGFFATHGRASRSRPPAGRRGRAAARRRR